MKVHDCVSLLYQQIVTAPAQWRIHTGNHQPTHKHCRKGYLRLRYSESFKTQQPCAIHLFSFWKLLGTIIVFTSAASFSLSDSFQNRLFSSRSVPKQDDWWIRMKLVSLPKPSPFTKTTTKLAWETSLIRENWKQARKKKSDVPHLWTWHRTMEK